MSDTVQGQLTEESAIRAIARRSDDVIMSWDEWLRDLADELHNGTIDPRHYRGYATTARELADLIQDLRRARAFPIMLVLSRRQAEAFNPLAPGGTNVAISITSPGYREADLRRGFADVLRLAFVDDCFDEWQERNAVLSPEDAERVIAFVDQWRHADRLLIHCEMGASRSVSMALALAQCYGAPLELAQRKHFPHPDYIPNPGVHSRICLAYQRARRSAR